VDPEKHRVPSSRQGPGVGVGATRQLQSVSQVEGLQTGVYPEPQELYTTSLQKLSIGAHMQVLSAKATFGVKKIANKKRAEAKNIFFIPFQFSTIKK